MKWYSQILHIAAIVATVGFVWVSIAQQSNGPVILTFTNSHGLHTGDIPVIMIGTMVVAILSYRLVRQTR